MSFLVTDLETVLDRTLPAPPEPTEEERARGKRETFPSPPLHRIVCAGWAILDASYVVKGWGVLGDDGEDERAIVSKLVEIVADLDPVVVTMNGRGFDLPVLAARAYVLGLPFAWYYKEKFGARYRYSRDDTYDVMDHLSDHGAAPRASLDVWAQACGWPGKPDGVSGASVEGMIAEGRHREVCAYCLGDVCHATAVLLRAELLRGALDLRGYVRAASALLCWAEEDPRTAALALGCDRARFLCDEALNDREGADEAGAVFGR